MGVSASAVSRVTGVTVTPRNFNTGSAAMLPQRLVVIGVGNSDVNYDTKKYVCEGTAYEIGQKYGFGSPLHLAALQLFPQVGSGATFPVTFIGVKFGESEGAAASGQISIEGSATSAGTVVIDLAGLEIEVTIAKGDTADDIKTKIINAVNAQTNRVATASATSGSVVNLTSRWGGVLGNRISLEVSSDVSGVAFTATEFANGAGTPDVTAALSEIGTLRSKLIRDPFACQRTLCLSRVLINRLLNNSLYAGNLLNFFFLFSAADKHGNHQCCRQGKCDDSSDTFFHNDIPLFYTQ